MKKYTHEKERRYASEIEIRKDDEEKKMIISGYALKFDNETLIGNEIYGYREVIKKGALDKTDMKKVPLKYNHDGGYLALASTKNDSLKLKVDDTGLKFDAELINTQANRDVYKMIESGLLSECSFAFTVDLRKGSVWNNSEKTPLREILKIDRLYDVALVDIPAYDNTTVYARSFELLENNLKAVEAELENERVIRSRINIKIKLGGLKE